MTARVYEAVRPTDDRIRLSELLGALSHALDLTEGQPPGHCVRSTWIGVHVGRALGLPDAQLWEFYYTVMMKDLGCSSNAARLCELYLWDDIVLKRDFKTVTDSLPKVLGFVFSHTGLQAGLAERFKAVLNVLQNGEKLVGELIETRCQRGAAIAARLRSARVSAPSTNIGTEGDVPTAWRARPSRPMRASRCRPGWSMCSAKRQAARPRL